MSYLPAFLHIAALFFSGPPAGALGPSPTLSAPIASRLLWGTRVCVCSLLKQFSVFIGHRDHGSALPPPQCL